MNIKKEDDLLDEFKLLESQTTDMEIDLIFDFVDEAFLAGEFDEIDNILLLIDKVEEKDILLMAWVVTSFWAKDKLKNRPDFFARVKYKFRDDPNRNELLRNLE